MIFNIQPFLFNITLIMSQEIDKARQEKQAYICENVAQDMYEDFHDFCTSYAGQINIDGWSLSYVYELVAKFKEYLIKRDQQQDQHEKSFAIYQTTSGGQNQIQGLSSQLQINSVLETLETNNKKQQQVKISPNQAMKKKVQKPPITQVKTVKQPQKNVEKADKNLKSALEILDLALQSVQHQQTSKMAQNAQKINKSFFESANFWQVPKIQQPKQQQKVNPIQQSPKKGIKLNLNVNELNSNSHKTNQLNIQVPKPQQNRSGSSNKNKMPQNKGSGGKKPQIPPTSNKSEIQAFNYSNPGDFSGFPNFPNANPNKGSNMDLKSEFDTFSMIAQQQFKKKRTTTQILTDPFQIQDPNRNKSSTVSSTSTIKLKQIRQIKNNTSSLVKQPYKGPKVFQNQFTDQVFCVKVTNRPFLAQENLRVQLKSYDIVQRSIFSSNYIMYNMVVLPTNIVCKRNYQDFTKLSSILQRFYPGIQIPYLEKSGWKSDTSDQFAKRQGQMIQFFMSDILRNPQLRNSRVIEQFLTFQDHKKMKRKFEEHEKMIKFKSIEQLCLLNGKVEIALTQKERIYNEGMNKLLTKTENNIEKYKKNCESLCHYYSQAMSTMLTIDDIIKEIQKDIEDFNKSVIIKQVENLDKSLKKIREGYKQSYFRMKFEKNVVQESIIPFLKYEKENTHVSKDIIQISNNLTNRYLKRIESQHTQPGDSSYMSAAYFEHKTGVMEESKSIVVLKYQAGFFQAQASSETQRILQNLGHKIDTLWKSIATKYLDQLARSVNVYSSIV